MDLGERAARMAWVEGRTWNEITEILKEPKEKVRSAARRYKQLNPGLVVTPTPPQVLAVEGTQPGDSAPDPEDVFNRACAEWERTKQLVRYKQYQGLVFDHGPIALVNMADLHLGEQGVNYPRIEAEAALIGSTPGMFVVGVGDWVNQYIVGKLKDYRNKTRLNIPDEWALLRIVLGMLGDSLVALVLGNHDNWLETLVGISYFEAVLEGLSPTVLYEPYDVLINVTIGEWTVPLRARHKWRGSSIYNDTHGIERAAKFDKNFVIGMGAHTHASGLVREFNNAGETGMAMLAGSYLEVSEFAQKQGFAHPNTSTAVAVVIDEKRRSLTGFGDLATCADYMGRMYKT